MKMCTKCGVDKEIDLFGKARGTKDGLNGHCKSCVSEHARKYGVRYREANRERIRDACREYRRLHKDNKIYKDKISEYNKRTSIKNANATRSRSYYRSHKHEIKILESCEKCDSTNNVQAHHWSYNYPMDVEFLCIDCHSMWHRSFNPLHRVTGIFTKKVDNLKSYIKTLNW